MSDVILAVTIGDTLALVVDVVVLANWLRGKDLLP
jgi:hypothetical protein